MKKEKNYLTCNRNFTLLLYPEDESHMKALEIIKQKYDYALIIHDKDVDSNGELKKEHIHCVIKVGNNQRWTSSVAEELGISTAYIEGCNLDKQLKYLIHFDNDDKYKYNFEYVDGNLKGRLLELINTDGKSEGQKIKELINYIESQNTKINITDFSIWCAEQGYWDIYRRASAIILRIIEDKNRRLKWG